MMTIDGIHIDSAYLTHTRIGFPKVKLKWNYQSGMHIDPYLVIDKVIHPWEWSVKHADKYGRIHVDIKHELKRFDDYVRSTFQDRPEFQG